MNLFFKSTVIALSITYLTACLEVEDNNDAVVTALQEQNDILAEQNAAQKSENSVTVTGKINNLSTDSAAQSASLTIKVGNEWSEAVMVATDGSFELVNLPGNSDYTLLIKSNNNSFVERVYFGTTKTTVAGISFQNIGLLNVSEGQLFSYSILDSITNEHIPALELYASSRVIQSNRFGAVSDAEDYYHTASFNAENFQYEIVLPKDISLSLYASLDIDNDGENDYRTETSSYSSAIVEASKINEQSTVYLVDLQKTAQEIEFRISVLDAESNIIANQSLTIDDQTNGQLVSEFDEDTLQYVLTAKLSSSLKILSPAFSVEGQSYRSGYISISNNNDEIYVQTYIYNQSGSYRSFSYYLPLDSETVDIVYQPQSAVSDVSDVELVFKSNNLSSINTEYKAYYSQPVAINADTVIGLKRKNVVSVTRGDDSSDDLVLAGATLLSVSDVDVTMVAGLSLNNTLLTINPYTSLLAGYQYQYVINDIVDSSTGALIDIVDDNSAVFDVESTDSFDINTLKLDNNNYYTNAELIKSENTAGEASNYSYGSNSSYLIIPEIATQQLKSLTIHKRLVTSQGSSESDFDAWQVIDNGQFNYSPSKGYAFSTATNEEVYNETGNVLRYIYKGMGISDGKVRQLNISEYLYDNTEASESSITFEYSYETRDGVVSAGIIVLPVL